MSKILMTAFHPSFQYVQAVAASPLYKFVVAIHKLTEGKVVCGGIVTPGLPGERVSAYMVTPDGWPFCRLSYYSDYDRRGNPCMKYSLSLFAGSAYSTHASGKNYSGIIALLRKSSTKGNDFRASLTEASNGRVGYVTSMIDSAATAYGGSDINSAYRVRSTLGTASTMWLLRVLKGDVLRTDSPPPEMKREFDAAIGTYDKVMAACTPALDAMQRMASSTKWVICQLNSSTGISGYMVGAFDCRDAFTHKREILAVGMNNSAKHPEVVVPFTYYKTLNDLDPTIRGDVMSQLHMMRISCEAAHPQVNFGNDGIPMHVQLSVPDAGWMVNQMGIGRFVMVDRTEEVTG